MASEEAMPEHWEDQAAVFYSWFESIGFNRYDGQLFPQFIEQPSSGLVNVTRTTKHELPTGVLPHRVPPMTGEEVLPHQKAKTAGSPEVSLKNMYQPIAMMTRSCDAKDPASYATCGLAIRDGDECKCWTYVDGYNIRTTLFLDRLMDFLKLPSRAFMFVQMKYLSKPIDIASVDHYCGPGEENCSIQLSFPPSARILQWSWFGQRTKYPLTKEGMLFAGCICLIFLLMNVCCTKCAWLSWMGVSKERVRKLNAINSAVRKSLLIRS
jgi:hypothetical protein